MATGATALLAQAPSAAAASPPPELDLRDYGAVGTGTVDDGPALQRAFDDLAMRGGGTLRVPAGKYAIRTPVSQAFSGRDFRVVGVGSSSQFILATGAGTAAITVSYAYRVSFESLTFVGTANTYPDVKRGVAFLFCLQASMYACSFYGLATAEAGGGVIYSEQSGLDLKRCATYGCTGNSGAQASVVESKDWWSLTAEDCIFWDVGDLNETAWSKTGIASAYCWIHLGEPRPLTNSASQREIRLVKVVMDEGAYKGFEVWPFGSTRAQNVLIDNLQVNGWAGNGGVGATVKGAEKVTIRQSWFGSTQGSTLALTLIDAGDVLLDRVTCASSSSMRTIKASDGTRSLTMVECDYGSLIASVPVLNVVSRGRQTTPFNMQNVSAPPSGGPTDGGLLFVQAGALRYRGAGGTVTTIAPA